MCEVAQSRSILSLGISCFRQKKTKRTNNNNSDQSQRTVDGNCKLKVQTFNIIVLCTENFVVEPASLKFLVEHGFDFNKQYAKGVSYTRGIDRVCLVTIRRSKNVIMDYQYSVTLSFI